MLLIKSAHRVIDDAQQAADLLTAEYQLAERSLYLGLCGYTIAVRSNSTLLIGRLADYFKHVAVDPCRPHCWVEAYETEPVGLDIEWRDWLREPGKSARKDTYHDLQQGRVLRKVKTGMIFLQSQSTRIAVGPCLRYQNQVINFINSQYMNELLNQRWLICHAAALQVGRTGIAIAGIAGGGKSSLMLSLMDEPDSVYVTNDRLFVRVKKGSVVGRGIAKMPRINPGTIVHNPQLHYLIDASRLRRLSALPKQALWSLEEKHDVMVDQVYGPDRIKAQIDLQILLILNWNLESNHPTQLIDIDLGASEHALQATMKSPGPFYQRQNGVMYQASMQLDEQPYIQALDRVRVLEVRGRIDIPFLKQKICAVVREGLE